MRTTPSLMLGAILLAPSAGGAQSAPDTAIKVTWGGFADAYYTYDFARPPTLDRSFFGGATFTTQPARSNEFNVNLAYIEASLSGNRLRGRVAFQAGTAVQSNYAAEPTIGIVSGPVLSRHIQEAYGGYQVTPKLWVDGGIFFSNMGMESWISKDNPTYTRSLVAEYSPYYSSGVRAIWQTNSKIAVRVDVVNGWQNISETNIHKGAGLRLDYTPNAATTFSYYNFFNGEILGRTRAFNGIGAKTTVGRTTLLGETDIGTLDAASGTDSTAFWWGFTAVARYQLTPIVAIVGRAEAYDDRDQVNIVTGLIDPFQGPGASLGIDFVPQPRLMWRTEVRGFFANDRIFPNGTFGGPRRGDGFVASSISVAF